MKLEDQVCNLELARRLKELGVKQEDAHFFWAHRLELGKNLRTRESLQENWDKGSWKQWLKEVNGGEVYAAFTVAELGFLLKQAGPEATIKAYGDLYGFKGTGSIGSIGMLWLLTEPDRLAKMLIYLIENKFITV